MYSRKNWCEEKNHTDNALTNPELKEEVDGIPKELGLNSTLDSEKFKRAGQPLDVLRRYSQ
jgi:hypothetical protein